MGVLGFFVGRCTCLSDLSISFPEDTNISVIEAFLFDLRHNRSIRKLRLKNSYIPRDFFRRLTPFIASNPSLASLNVNNCEMDAEQYRTLSLALRGGRALTEFFINRLVRDGRYDDEDSIIDNIEALKMHPQLGQLTFSQFVMGRNVCESLSDLLRQLDAVHALRLGGNGINDSGVEALLEGIASCSALKHLYLSENPSITASGWSAVSALLEDPGSSLQLFVLQSAGIDDEKASIIANSLARNNTLEKLFLDSNPNITARGYQALSTLLEDPNSRLALLNLMGNGIDDESAIILANALAHNTTLERMYLDENPDITSNGWQAFSKVLCDTSSVNNTFLSNHTLQHLTGTGWDFPVLSGMLNLNIGNDKKAVAFRKILLHHADFDMQPLFEWDLKVLPFVASWFERAAVYRIESEGDSRKRKLAAIYQFIRGCRSWPLKVWRGKH